jgi:hypothetical protein
MHKCVTNVIGLESTTASPSDTWLLEFHPDTKYDDKPCHYGFLKWWIEPTTVKTSYEVYGQLTALNYEKRVYSEIIKPIITKGICPNFIKYLGSGTQCSLVNMKNILLDKTKTPTGELLSGDQLTYNLLRNILYIINGLPDRPSINSIDKAPTQVNIKMTSQIAQTARCNLLVNDAVQIGTKSFRNWFQTRKRLNNETLRVIFQIMCACYAMNLSHMVHNDLHSGNIMVETFVPSNVTYIIDDKPYTFMNIIHKASVFDFDRSYVERLGYNDYIDKYCHSHNQCNYYESSNKDALKIFGYIFHHVSKAEQQIICDILCTYKNDYDILIDIYNNGWHLMYKNQPLQTFEYKRFNSMEGIIRKLSSYLSQDETGVLLSHPSSILKENTYICNKNMFNSDGSLK